MITEIEKEFNKCLNDNLDLMCNDAYIVTKDGYHIDLIDFRDGKIMSQIKEHINQFDHINITLAYQPYEESFEDIEKTYIETKEKIKALNNLNLQYWDVYYDLDKMTNYDNTGWQFLCTQVISLKNPQILKGDDKMTIKLNKEAVNEIFKVKEDVKEISEYMDAIGFTYHSDSWYATNIWYDSEKVDAKEDILCWSKKDFENISMDKITAFFIGGSISTVECLFNDNYIEPPLEIEEAKGEVVKTLLNRSLPKNAKYFNFEIYDEGIEVNCGWEHSIGIKAIPKNNAFKNIKDKLVTEISEHYKNHSETYYDGGAFEDDVGDYYAYVEIWSDLINHEESTYQSIGGVNTRFIKKAYKEIKEMEKTQKEINKKYGDKVKTFLTDWNDTIEYGCVLYVYIL